MDHLISKEAESSTEQEHIIIIFHKPQYFVQCGKTYQLGVVLMSSIFKRYPCDILDLDKEYRAFQKHICQLNGTIPDKLWPNNQEMKWDYLTEETKAHHDQILTALREYKTAILDPYKWSQNPWEYHEITEEKIEHQQKKQKQEEKPKCKTCGRHCDEDPEDLSLHMYICREKNIERREINLDSSGASTDYMPDD